MIFSYLIACGIPLVLYNFDIISFTTMIIWFVAVICFNWVSGLIWPSS